MSERGYTVIDEFVIRLDRYLSLLFDSPNQTERPYPAHGIEASPLESSERSHSEGLMRVNHAGEVSAQALYKAQSITVRDEDIRETMRRSANEEADHLFWCKYRLDELDGRTSYLGPFWFVGSFAIGLAAGIIGDNWNLGFVVETEDLGLGCTGFLVPLCLLIHVVAFFSVVVLFWLCLWQALLLLS